MVIVMKLDSGLHQRSTVRLTGYKIVIEFFQAERFLFILLQQPEIGSFLSPIKEEGLLYLFILLKLFHKKSYSQHRN